MNEELTSDWIEGALSTARQVTIMGSSTVERLATALLEERAKPKVWDGSPDNATVADIYWSNEWGFNLGSKRHTRELPKTRARQIAKQEGHWLAEKHGWSASEKELVTNVMESALTKYAEELTNTKETN